MTTSSSWPSITQGELVKIELEPGLRLVVMIVDDLNRVYVRFTEFELSDWNREPTSK